MTKFYRSQRRRSRRGVLVLIVLAILAGLVAAGGYYFWQNREPEQNQNTTAIDENATKYISFAGGYLFSIPANYSIDETLISGVVVSYPDDSPPKPGMSLEELYKTGAVAIQPIHELKDNNPKAFKEYVNEKLGPEVRESLKSLLDVREAKQGNVEALKVFALDQKGKRLNAMYAVNFTKPILMVAAEESNALKIIGSTVQELKDAKAKSEIDSAAQAAKAALELIVQRNVSALSSKSVDSFSPENLAADIESSGSLLDRPVTIVGGSYKDDAFVAQMVFQPKTNGEVPAGGVVAMKKENGTWKLETVQLPKP